MTFFSQYTLYYTQYTPATVSQTVLVFIDKLRDCGGIHRQGMALWLVIFIFPSEGIVVEFVFPSEGIVVVFIVPSKMFTVVPYSLK